RYFSEKVVVGGWHGLDDILPRVADLETVGVGKQRSFGGNVGDVSLEIGVRLQPLDDLLAGQAFGERDLVVDRLALDQRVEHLAHGGVLSEFVFTSLQGTFAPQIGEVNDAGHEQAAVGDHLVVLEPLGDAAHALAFGNHHHGGRVERAWKVELQPQEIEQSKQSAGGEQHQHEQCVEKCEHRVHAPRLALRKLRRSNRLQLFVRTARRRGEIPEGTLGTL